MWSSLKNVCAMPRGLKIQLVGVRAQRKPGHSPHRHGEQGVSGIAVLKVLPGDEVERALPDHEVEDVAFGDDITVTPAREGQQMRLLAQAAGVVSRGDRRVIGPPKSGTSGTKARTSSSSETLPSSSRSKIAIAVNCLVIDPTLKTVAGVIGTPCSRLAMPWPRR